MIPCPICGRASDGWTLTQAQQVTPPVAALLQQRAAGWLPAQGACPQCVLTAAREHARTRSAFALHTRTQPHTTFPYYHPDDESVLALPQRLPDYFSLPAEDVGIAFLDSGFFPHPDLCAEPPPAEIEWERLDAARMRKTILRMQPRFLEYVDLTGGGEERGMKVESLWHGDGLSWHGEMTTTIAAGNGALSAGRYRGYASRASVLPIRVGRGDGRIPESDILAGFQWLLKQRRWQRYGVRVLNVSVGGDFPQDWRFNPVCQAAQRLNDEGVLIVAAAGNRPVEELLAPAQTPGVITAGGVDDHNRYFGASVGQYVSASVDDDDLDLYPHNYGVVHNLPSGTPTHQATDVLTHRRTDALRKPELLAPARYIPSPMLPVHTAFRETHAIERLRATLRENDARADTLVEHWQRVLRGELLGGDLQGGDLQGGELVGGELERVRHPIADLALGDDEDSTAEWMGDIWQPLRKRMNAQKWTHAAYQHVDGTSVSTAVISSVAAQMVQANSALAPAQIKELLCETALDLPSLPIDRRGAGLIQPARAVAAALRTQSGRLVGYPHSATPLSEVELRKWRDLLTIAMPAHAELPSTAYDEWTAVYFGLLAPGADGVAWVGEQNCWQLDANPLRRGRNGWWQTVLLLPSGRHAYRFCVRTGSDLHWCADPESTQRTEGGYQQPDGDHSVIFVP